MQREDSVADDPERTWWVRARDTAWRLLFGAWSKLVKFLTSEWLLERDNLPNGGSVILLRAFLASLYIFFGVLAFRNGLDPERSWTFDLDELLAQVIATPHWFGAIFAASYAGLYARFASQWKYLAHVYNQIKAAQLANGSPVDALAEWKAGFLEDADVLHLATKPIFASIIKEWGQDPQVEKEFIEHTPGGEKRFHDLMRRVNSAYRLHEEEVLSSLG